MKYKELLLFGVEELKKVDIKEADLDARLLLEHVCHTTRNDLLLYPDKEVSDMDKECYVNLIKERAKRVPLQHIIGIQSFMGLDFYVNQYTLIPRQDTEILVEEAMRHLHDGMHILDVCTGSGCILISLLHYSNECHGVGIDISKEALEVAAKNADTLLGAEKDYFFYEGDLFDALKQESSICKKYDIIVSNPPYIKTSVIETLEPEVKQFEPMAALDGMEDGLFFYRRILDGVDDYLCRNGMLFFEIGHDQAKEVSDLMEEKGFIEVKVKKDYAGCDRVVYGIYLPKDSL